MNKWDVVLLIYPFSDLSATKLRPALVVSPNSENACQEDAVFLLITSNTHRGYPFDIIIDDQDDEFSGTGLIKSSAIRVNKVITLKKTLVSRTLGTLGPNARATVQVQLARFFETT